MKYPNFMRKINNALGAFAGTLMLLIGILCVMESILRTVFLSPTSWGPNITQYLLITSIFLGCSYAYQEKGHVGVELIRDVLQKKFGVAPRRVMSIIGYLLSLAVIIVTLVAIVNVMVPAFQLGQVTAGRFDIPITILYGIMIAGSIVMAVTVFFIILDLFKDDKYL